MMKTVREGWVVFGPDGSMLTGPHIIEYYAWCQAGYTWSESVKHCKNMGYTCRRVRVTIEEIDEKGE